MSEAAGQKIIYLILGIIVVVLVILFFSQQTLLFNFLSGKGWTILNQEVNDQQLIIFGDFQNVINTCVKSIKTNCFCQNQNTNFATSYRLGLKDYQETKITFTLQSDKKQELGNFILDYAGCNIIKKVSTTKLDDQLYLIFGQKPQIEYKRSKFDFDSSHIFYKNSNGLCVVEKNMLVNLDKTSIC